MESNLEWKYFLTNFGAQFENTFKGLATLVVVKNKAYLPNVPSKSYDSISIISLFLK